MKSTEEAGAHIYQSLVVRCYSIFILGHFCPCLLVAEQTPASRENLGQRDTDAAVDNYGEAEHPRASAEISIHNKHKLIKVAYKRQSPQITFFKDNFIYMLFKKRHTYTHM